MRWGDIRYARAGDHHIAYREVVGDERSDLEIVMVSGVYFPMESLTDDPVGARLVEGLAGLGRLVMFDRRGVALSDPVSDWETPLLEQWSDDLVAVINDSGCVRPVVFSWHGLGIARACAIRDPDVIDRLILFNPSSQPTEGDSAWAAEFVEGIDQMRAGEGATRAAPMRPNLAQWADKHAPFRSRLDDPEFQMWNDAAGRAGASPTQAARLDIGYVQARPDNRQVRTPTLVINRTRPDYVIPEEFFQRAAHEIPGAQHAVLATGDPSIFGVGIDAVLAEISNYLIGEVRLPPPERQIAAILFTDLVGSTRRAAVAGDAAWRRLLDRHDNVSRTEVSHRGGEVVKTTGDGILALLPSATAAIEAAQAIRAHLDHDDLQVRVGVHVGEIDRRGDDVSGLAVNTAARIMSTSEPGQILVSTVVTLTTSAASFASIGPQQLKDIDGTWELHSVV